MTNFEGWLIKFGGVELPLKYLGYDKCSGTPNTRAEKEAYRDCNYLLHRSTYDKYKTKLSWSTVDELTLEEKIAMQEVFRAGLLDEKERKYACTYWNDDINAYVYGEFYMTDTTYTWKQIDKSANTIIYGEITIEMMEY